MIYSRKGACKRGIYLHVIFLSQFSDLAHLLPHHSVRQKRIQKVRDELNVPQT